MFVLLSTLSFFAPKIAMARPEYAEKEGRACQYCHNNSNPGKIDASTGKRFSTERNEHGIYYGSHNHTFAGFVEKSVVSAKAPQLTYEWREEFTDSPRRAVVADITGDGSLRLVSLHQKPDDKNAAILKIRQWDGKKFVVEFETDVKGSPNRLAAGKFGGKNRPCQIVTEDALWVWNGKSYTRRGSSKRLPIFGITRQRDGSERLLLAESPDKVTSWTVNSEAAGDWLSNPTDPPASKEVVWRDMHADSDFFEKMGFPADMSLGSAMGLWTLPKINKLYLYQIKAQKDFDLIKNPDNSGKPTLVYKGIKGYSVTIRNIESGIESWGTPQIPGTAFDVALDDPKNGGKPGIVTLFGGITPDKPCVLYFFKFD